LLKIQREIGSPPAHIARVLTYLGITCRDLGRYQEALNIELEALARPKKGTPCRPPPPGHHPRGARGSLPSPRGLPKSPRGSPRVPRDRKKKFRLLRGRGIPG
jgi:hypothetical protein